MTACIEATSKNQHGYGQAGIWIGGKEYKVAAHRMAWELEHGPIPEGMRILHQCDNPGCVNVEHLVLGTQADNMQDMARKGREWNQNMVATHCIHGHEFTPENTRRYKKRRVCKECSRRTSLAYYYSKGKKEA